MCVKEQRNLPDKRIIKRFFPTKEFVNFLPFEIKCTSNRSLVSMHSLYWSKKKKSLCSILMFIKWTIPSYHSNKSFSIESRMYRFVICFAWIFYSKMNMGLNVFFSCLFDSCISHSNTSFINEMFCWTMWRLFFSWLFIQWNWMFSFSNNYRDEYMCTDKFLWISRSM